MFYTCLIAGKNPEEIIKKYDSNIKVEKYIKYKFSDSKKLRKSAISLLKSILKKDDGNKEIKERLEEYEAISDFEYYRQLVNGLYEIDDNGNAWTTSNPNGKYVFMCLGKNFAKPLISLDGKETYSALKKDIDWPKIHMNMESVNTYKVVWELIKEGREPLSDVEKTLYNNMKGWEKYFNNFKSSDDYVSYNTSLWYYAFCDENGWKDIDTENKTDYEWVHNFFDTFIKDSSPDTLFSVYEYKKSDS